MVVDSSALVAVALDEPERAGFVDRILGDRRRLISAASWTESAIVLAHRRGSPAVRDLEELLAVLGLNIRALDADQARTATDAYLRFGKGRHPAGLNICDCFSYALARSTGEALLFKGSDFSKTDITPA